MLSNAALWARYWAATLTGQQIELRCDLMDYFQHIWYDLLGRTEDDVPDQPTMPVFHEDSCEGGGWG